MHFSKAILLIAIVATAGCSVTPYRNDFACALKDDYGKCIDMAGAYEEAVTGRDSGAPRLSKKGKAVEPVTTPVGVTASPTAAPVQSSPDSAALAVSAAADEFGAYRAAVYQQMRGMLTNPTAPMIRPARTVRTLIISYENRENRNRLYMPRYVFSISEESQFVMGEYLNRRSDLVPASVVQVSEDSMQKDVH